MAPRARALEWAGWGTTVETGVSAPNGTSAVVTVSSASEEVTENPA